MIEIHKIVAEILEDSDRVLLRGYSRNNIPISHPRFYREPYLRTGDIPWLFGEEAGNSYDQHVIIDDIIFQFLDDSLDRRQIGEYYWLREDERLLLTIATVDLSGNVVAADYIYNLSTNEVCFGYVGLGEVEKDYALAIGGKYGFEWRRGEGIISLRFFDIEKFRELPGRIKDKHSTTGPRILVPLITKNYYKDWIEDLFDAINFCECSSEVIDLLMNTKRIREYLERTGRL